MPIFIIFIVFSSDLGFQDLAGTSAEVLSHTYFLSTEQMLDRAVEQITHNTHDRFNKASNNNESVSLDACTICMERQRRVLTKWIMTNLWRFQSANQNICYLLSWPQGRCSSQLTCTGTHVACRTTVDIRIRFSACGVNANSHSSRHCECDNNKM